MFWWFPYEKIQCGLSIARASTRTKHCRMAKNRPKKRTKKIPFTTSVMLNHNYYDHVVVNRMHIRVGVQLLNGSVVRVSLTMQLFLCILRFSHFSSAQNWLKPFPFSHQPYSPDSIAYSMRFAVGFISCFIFQIFGTKLQASLFSYIIFKLSKRCDIARKKSRTFNKIYNHLHPLQLFGFHCCIHLHPFLMSFFFLQSRFNQIMRKKLI